MENDSYTGGVLTPVATFLLEFLGSVILGFLIGLICAVVK